MEDLVKSNKGDSVYCPLLCVAFVCDTEEKKESVKRFNEQTKRLWKKLKED